MSSDPNIQPNDTPLQEKNGCNFNNRMKIIVFITLVCCLVAIIIPLSIAYVGPGTCSVNEDCSNDRQYCHQSRCTATNYTCFEGYFCSSIYGKAIRGDKDLLATSCSMDTNCTAFR